MESLAGACFCILLITSLILLYLYLRKIYNYWKDRGIEYDKPLPVVGNLGFLMRRSFWYYFFDLKDRFPSDYLGIFLGWTPVLVVQTPELARRILSKDFEYFQDRSIYSGSADPLGSLNLFTVKHPLWKTLRYELSAMFTTVRLKSITKMMNLNALELVKKIERDVTKKNQIKLKEVFSMYASDVVANTVFGIQNNILNDKPSPLWHITKHMVRWSFWRGFELTMIFLVPPVAALLRYNFFSGAASDYLRKLFWNVAETRLRSKALKDKDFLDILLHLKDKVELSKPEMHTVDDIILAQAAVFIMASIETSSTTLSFLLHELAYHPEAQEKLFKEISEAVELKQTDILEYTDYVEMKYLTACINETLRLRTPGAFLDRLCAKDYKVDDHLTIEKGTVVFVNTLAMHYNEKVYPENEKWKPERFLSSHTPENDNNRFTFLAFGDGPHACIGKRYALMQIKASITQLLLKYKFEPARPYHVECDPYSILMAPHKELSINFVPR